MFIRKTLFIVAATLMLGGHATAQNDTDKLREIEAREAEAQKAMREAEKQLDEAARRIAELSNDRLAALGEAQRWRYEFGDRPRLGVNIENDGSMVPVEGVRIISVSPGSAADEAGLRVGDIITAVNDEPMSGDSTQEANMKLLDFMAGVEEGDKLDVEYMRGSKVGTIEVEPRAVSVNTFAFGGPGVTMPDVHVSPGSPQRFVFSFPGARGAWSDLELVELNEGLGRYFGTDKGLLVISAPESNAFKLQDGDVIQSIDGRDPTSVNHCMRILTSYQPGEKLVLNIMRDKKQQEIEVEVPDDRTSSLFRSVRPLRPASAPAPVAPPAPPQPAERT